MPRERLASAYLYFDATVDDARLCLTVARTAAVHGAVVLNPQDPFEPQHGFLRNANGTYQQIDFPGSSGSNASGINDAPGGGGDFGPDAFAGN